MTILENKARRQILEMLVREPHYPLQLSHHLEISQQAVMKHLKILEDAGFVQSEKVKSDKGGPPKKIYSVQQSFSLRLDLGPDMFRSQHRTLPPGGPARLSGKLPRQAVGIDERVGGRRKVTLSEAVELVDSLQSCIEELDAERDALLALHQQVMSRASNAVDEHFDDYAQRSLVHTMLERPSRPVDLDAWSESLRLEAMHAEDVMEEVRERMMIHIAEANKGVIVAGKPKQLPWWAALDENISRQT